MAGTPEILAKLAGLRKALELHTGEREGRVLQYVKDRVFADYFNRYSFLRDQLSSESPDLFGDMPRYPMPGRSGSDSYLVSDLKFYVAGQIDYIFEVVANSRIHAPAPQEASNNPKRIFISHGRSADWHEVQRFLEKDLHIDTLELAQEPNQGRTVLQKLSEESERCSFAVIVMTGDDDLGTGGLRARENVMHEIGFFQGKYGLENVCLLYEEGTSIPSNIHGLVYVPYPKGYVQATFSTLQRELRVAFPRV